MPHDDARTPAPGPTPPDARQLRAALGRFTTGVTVITCRAPGGERVGLTANSFNALSLAPPLVLWSLRQASASLAAFQAAGHFAVNVLAEAQLEVSRRFASAQPGKFDEGNWTEGLHGLPVLVGSAAVFECSLYSQQVAGDHVLFIGQVERAAEADLPPLVYQAGHYRLLGEAM